MIIMLILTALMAGCGTKPTQEATPPATAQLGVIDMDMAVKAHPKYKELIELGKKADAMTAQLQAEEAAVAQQAQQIQNMPVVPETSQQELEELGKNFEQEINVKLAAKEREIQDKLMQKADGISKQLTEELNAYGDQLEKEYQPQLFNIQLKLKVVQLSKEEATVLEAEQEKLQTQRGEAMKAKHEELSKRMDERMVAERAPLEQEALNYRKQLEDELAKKMADKQTEILSRDNGQHIPALPMNPSNSPMPEALAKKQQEIEALQGFILDDITDKTAKVAIQNGFEMVLTHVIVNVSAVDITTQVINECKK